MPRATPMPVGLGATCEAVTLSLVTAHAKLHFTSTFTYFDYFN